MDKRSNLRNFIWNFVGMSINAFMSLVYQIIVTRVNGLEASGVFTVCFSLSLIIQTVANLGGRVFEVADRDGNDDSYYTLKWIAAIVSIAIALLFAVINGYDKEKIKLLMLLMLTRIVESFSDTVYAVLQKEERLDLIGISYVLKNVAAISMFIFANLLTGNLLFSTGIMLVATFVVFVTYDRLVCRSFHVFHGIWDIEASIGLIKQIYGFLGYNLLIMVIANMPKMIADLRFSDSQMGYFGILMMLPTVMLLLGQIIVQQYLTKITMYYRTEKYWELVKLLFCVFTWIVALTTLCCVAAYFLGAPILNFVYGLSFENYKLIMLLAIVAGMFNVFVTVLSAVLTVMNKSRQQMCLYAIVAVTEVAVLSIGISEYVFASAFVMYLVIMMLQFLIFAAYFVMGLKEKIECLKK